MSGLSALRFEISAQFGLVKGGEIQWYLREMGSDLSHYIINISAIYFLF
jgi:hypothetical protein